MYLNYLGSLLSYLYVNINTFLEQFSRRPEQKTENWYKLRADIIGGSELKPFMSDNWEESTISIMNKKLGFTTVNYDIPACHWGNLFEECTERLVEISLGCKIVGNNSNIPAPPDSGLEKIHANSPDGIGVISYYTIPGAAPSLLTTDIVTQMDALCAEIKSYTVVFEFKSTVSRIPTDKIPTMYLPQVWSGLVCVPIADFALYVDVVYRLCDKNDLNNSNYNSEYHLDSRNLSEEILSCRLPVAIGLTAIYAPRMNTPDDKLLYKIHNPHKLYENTIDPKHDAYTLSMTLTLNKNNNHKIQKFEPIDFGGLQEDSGNIETGCDVRRTINKILSMIDKKYFIHKHTDPCFLDGRGCIKLLTEDGTDELIDEFKQNAPDGYYLLGYLPWKVFDIRYIPEERNSDFLQLITPRLKKFIAEYDRIKLSENPRKEFELYRDNLTINTEKGKAKQQKSIDTIMEMLHEK